MIKKLALLGGQPVFNKPLPFKKTFGKEELAVATKVIKSGVLSDFVGSVGEKFLGGKWVKELESAYCKKFNVRYAVAMNSASTSLHAAVAALEIGPGDEVILPPITMSATATAILLNNAVPVFVDVEKENVCLDPKMIEAKITKRTKAIMVVDLYGQGANLPEIMKIAKKYHLKVIEDNAQSPGAKIGEKFVGTIGDVGIFSLNFHKVINCGEGGILVTNDAKIAYRAQLVRNHGEVVMNDLSDYETVIYGTNYRMTELQAAIAVEQLKKLDFLNNWRIDLANYLTKKLQNFEGLLVPVIKSGFTYVYYQYHLRFLEKKVGIKRKTFAKALKAEGFSLGEGWVKPLYLFPLYQQKMMYKKGVGCPFECKYYDCEVNYKKGLCPAAEELCDKELMLSGICAWPLTKKHLDLFVLAINKVLENVEELKKYEKRTEKK